jgi:hypothetical protein
VLLLVGSNKVGREVVKNKWFRCTSECVMSSLSSGKEQNFEGDSSEERFRCPSECIVFFFPFPGGNDGRSTPVTSLRTVLFSRPEER